MDTGFGKVRHTSPNSGQPILGYVPKSWTVPTLRNPNPWTPFPSSTPSVKPHSVDIASQCRFCYNSAHHHQD